MHAGRDAVGLGASIGHPRESEEWLGMTMAERYAFFAPIWRVMRDDNMTVDEVERQIKFVALAVKQGSQVGVRLCVHGNVEHPEFVNMSSRAPESD